MNATWCLDPDPFEEKTFFPPILWMVPGYCGSERMRHRGEFFRLKFKKTSQQPEGNRNDQNKEKQKRGEISKFEVDFICQKLQGN